MPKYVVHVECCYKSRGIIEADSAVDAESKALTAEGLTEEYDDDCYTSATLATEKDLAEWRPSATGPGDAGRNEDGP